MSRVVHEFWRQKLREELCREIRVEFYQSRQIVQSIQHVKVEFECLAGIDKVMWLANGLRNTYEDKTDFVAARTQNLFLETWSKMPSAQSKGVRGWGYTCGAQYIDFFVPQHRTVLIGETLRLKALVRQWEAAQTYQAREVKNPSYVTKGLLVPLLVVAREAGLKAFEIEEAVMRRGVQKYLRQEAQKQLGVLVDERVIEVVSELAEHFHETLGRPLGQIPGLAYSADAEAATLGNRTQADIVRDRLWSHGEISDEWFTRYVGARLAPVVDILRQEGWVIECDRDARSYRLVAPGSDPVDGGPAPLPLFA